MDPFYTLIGTDGFLKTDFLDGLVQKIAPPLQTYHRQSKQISDLLDEWMMFSMLGEKRLFIVTQNKELNEKQQEALLAYIENPTSNTFVVWVLEKIDKRKSFYKTLLAKTKTVTLEPPKLSQMSSWVDRLIQKQGVQIQRDAKPLLIDAVGTDLGRLNQEIQKLSLFIHPRTTIEQQDVMQMVLKLSGEDIFVCTDAVIEGNRKKALETLHYLFESGVSPFAIATMLARHLRILLKMADAKKQRIASNQMARFVGVPPFTLPKYQKHYQQFSPRKCIDALNQLKILDTEMKSIAIGQNRQLERAVLRLF